METTAEKILVTGASGLVGSNLVPFLTSGGHEVIKLVRTNYKLEEGVNHFAIWDSEKKEFVKLHQSTLAKVDVFENIIKLTAEGQLKTKSKLTDIFQSGQIVRISF